MPTATAPSRSTTSLRVLVVQFQDGQAASQLVNVGLGNGGAILAQYSDGQQVTVGQVALASIAQSR
jgi:flagellar hook protein FlgE